MKKCTCDLFPLHASIRDVPECTKEIHQRGAGMGISDSQKKEQSLPCRRSEEKPGTERKRRAAMTKDSAAEVR